MSYHYDWITRQIEAISAMLRYIVSGEKTHLVQVEAEAPSHSGGNELYLQLSALLRQGKICDAEDLLFEALDDPSAQVLDAAVRFYDDLNRLTDVQLQEANFSRQEIMEGLQHTCEIFGIPV